ncbi:dienelactone hydrolase family protein [Heyndrickxia sp. NPDC080065]|uniref:dienelactone hydrolase family protein n=1 Tax=Heyndrickxia sp. NPDC080065 TaxID=3390568 RepID=UPI003CFD72C7
MIVKNNHSDIAILVVHEIYGLNQHMLNFCEILGKQGFDVFCPNMIEREAAFAYSEEKAAYSHFMENIGFNKALNNIRHTLSSIQNKYEKIIIIGFSVGATVAWLCSEISSVNGIVGYYGSRIREYTDITPQCPVLLFFPEEEPTFSVDDLISKLSEKLIDIHKLKGKHGFGDPYSSNYQKESAKKAIEEIIGFINMNIMDNLKCKEQWN